MKKFSFSVALLVVIGSVSGLQAESTQKAMKRIECESGCDAQFNETVDRCENEHQAKGLGQDVIERLCDDAGNTAKEKCLADCTSK